MTEQEKDQNLVLAIEILAAQPKSEGRDKAMDELLHRIYAQND